MVLPQRLRRCSSTARGRPRLCTDRTQVLLCQNRRSSISSWQRILPLDDGAPKVTRNCTPTGFTMALHKRACWQRKPSPILGKECATRSLATGSTRLGQVLLSLGPGTELLHVCCIKQVHISLEIGWQLVCISLADTAATRGQHLLLESLCHPCATANPRAVVHGHPV